MRRDKIFLVKFTALLRRAFDLYIALLRRPILYVCFFNILKTQLVLFVLMCFNKMGEKDAGGLVARQGRQRS